MRTGIERACWQPHGGDAAGGGISVVAHLAGEDQPARAAQLLVVGNGGGGRRCNAGNRRGAPRTIREFHPPSRGGGASPLPRNRRDTPRGGGHKFPNRTHLRNRSQ